MLVSDHEIDVVMASIKSAASKVFSTAGFTLAYKVGCMLEVPRACIRADQIGMEDKGLSFVAIGSSNLTELVYGCSRSTAAKFSVSANVIPLPPAVRVRT